MDYPKFKQLVALGEKDYLDYKITSDAFLSSSRAKLKANAELVKDIIAMSNNGGKTSYIIIGVSDDRLHFASVKNPKLTDDNLQRLLRDFVFPMPKVTLERKTFSGSSVLPQHKAKDFIIIKIGPQPRQCFRFNKEIIDWDEETCFKKNEVWIRRGSTSDTATPEEIKRLLEGKDYLEVPTPENNIDYTTLPKHFSGWNPFRGKTGDDELTNLRAVHSDLTNFLYKIDGKIEWVSRPGEKPRYSKEPEKYPVAHIPIGNEKYKLLVYVEDKTYKGFAQDAFKYAKVPYHGLLYISLGNVTKTSVELVKRSFKFPWGWFIIPYNNKFAKQLGYLHELDLGEDLESFAITLKNIHTTQDLEVSLAKAIESLSLETEPQKIIQTDKAAINKAFEQWLTLRPQKPKNITYEVDSKARRLQIKRFLLS